MSDLAKREEQLPARATIHDVFLDMARDPSIDPARIASLMDLQLKAEAHNAEREFNVAFARLLPKIPRVRKDGTIDMGAKGIMKFAKYEDVDTALRPIYTAEGFSLSFISEPCASGAQIVAVLRHAAGHELRSTMTLPPDAGAGRNALQANGSTQSYCKRYLTCNLFNVVTVNEDDDAQKLSQIDQRQIDNIEDLMTECKLSPEARSKMLAMFGIKALGDATKALYPALINFLLAKRNALGSKDK